MSYYRTCPHCGAHLDPGEVCDCRETKKTALDATNIQDGGKEVQKFIDRDDFETCLHCSFYPGGGSWMCLAPWTDARMEDDDIEPCREGVYRYMSGQPGPHLKRLIDKDADYLWLREKGEFTAKNPAATRKEDSQ